MILFIFNCYDLIKINTSDGSFDLNFGKNGFVNGVKTLTPPVIFNNSIYLVTFEE